MLKQKIKKLEHAGLQSKTQVNKLQEATNCGFSTLQVAFTVKLTEMKAYINWRVLEATSQQGKLKEEEGKGIGNGKNGDDMEIVEAVKASLLAFSDNNLKVGPCLFTSWL